MRRRWKIFNKKPRITTKRSTADDVGRKSGMTDSKITKTQGTADQSMSFTPQTNNPTACSKSCLKRMGSRSRSSTSLKIPLISGQTIRVETGQTLVRVETGQIRVETGQIRVETGQNHFQTLKMKTSMMTKSAIGSNKIF